MGSASFYGANVAHVTLNADGSVTNIAPAGGSIPITTNNYFFGDFKRDNADPNTGNREVRDFSDLSVPCKVRQAALAAGGSVGWDDAADPNSRSVANTGSYTFTSDMAFTPTKGDLIAMGDFNSDGSFDGKDLYLMKRTARHWRTVRRFNHVDAAGRTRLPIKCSGVLAQERGVGIVANRDQLGRLYG